MILLSLRTAQKDTSTTLDYTQSSIEKQFTLRKTSTNALPFQYQFTKKWKHQVEIN